MAKEKIKGRNVIPTVTNLLLKTCYPGNSGVLILDFYKSKDTTLT